MGMESIESKLDKKKTRLGLLIFAMILRIVSVIIITIYAGWQVCLGIILIMWAMNIERSDEVS